MLHAIRLFVHVTCSAAEWKLGQMTREVSRPIMVVTDEQQTVSLQYTLSRASYC